MKTHVGAWNDPSRAHCGAQNAELTNEEPTCKRCKREAGRRFEIAMQNESESLSKRYSPLAGEEGRPSYRAPTNAEIIAEIQAKRAARDAVERGL